MSIGFLCPRGSYGGNCQKESSIVTAEQMLTDSIMLIASKMYQTNDIHTAKYKGLKHIYDVLRRERSVYTNNYITDIKGEIK